MTSRTFRATIAGLLVVLVLAVIAGAFSSSSSASQWTADGPARWRTFDQHAPETPLQVARGNFTDTVAMTIFGRNPDIDAQAAEDIWETGGDYDFPDVAEAVTIVSDSAEDDATPGGTGAWSVTVYGLDANFDLVEETILLDGLTPVTTTQTFRRVHLANAVTAGTTMTNVGTITATQAVTTTLVLFQIAPVFGRTNLGFFTVPRGHTLLLTRVYASVARTQSTIAGVSARVRNAGLADAAFREFGYAGVSSTGSSWISVGYQIPNEVEEFTDIILRAFVTGNNTDVNAGLDGYLIDNR